MVEKERLHPWMIFFCEVVSNRDLFDVHDGLTCVERAGCWDLAEVGHAEHRSVGYAFLEWVTEIISGPTDADCEIVTRDSGEFLEYR